MHFVGDPVPWFSCRSTNNPLFHFATAAGRYIILSFYGSMSTPAHAECIRTITGDLRKYFDDAKVSFFGISTDAADESESRVQEMLPGIRYFWDFDRKVTALYNMAEEPNPPGTPRYDYPHRTIVLDPLLRVIANISMKDPVAHHHVLKQLLVQLPDSDNHAQVPVHAPVLILPRIFERSFCQELIKLYEKQGGEESGFMREREGKTVPTYDNHFKRRKDLVLDGKSEFDDLRNAIRARIVRRIVPEIKKVFQFEATRMERYLVACYESENKGFFSGHRDNTTKATAHRKFACTINLNAEDYTGGDLCFREFGTRTYRAPTGGAVVFSCGLLHEATPVTAGKRYAFLPFFYDEAAAKIREENIQFLSKEAVRIS